MSLVLVPFSCNYLSIRIYEVSSKDVFLKTIIMIFTKYTTAYVDFYQKRRYNVLGFYDKLPVNLEVK